MVTYCIIESCRSYKQITLHLGSYIYSWFVYLFFVIILVSRSHVHYNNVIMNSEVKVSIKIYIFIFMFLWLSVLECSLSNRISQCSLLHDKRLNLLHPQCIYRLVAAWHQVVWPVGLPNTTLLAWRIMIYSFEQIYINSYEILIL